MAIVQISRITHRKGLGENLPQLAGAEFGWVVDERKLYIGNGTLEEGAPAIGNTEILTEYSDILNIANTYTYKGEEAGYTVDTGPTTRSLQNKLDDFASVRDFGAVGDGVTDDTAAINRALFQLFCREDNSEIRRSLFFPAGTYLVSNSIDIPPFAKLYGEGSESSIIKLAENSGSDYVARTADSDQNTGVNIGNNSATAPIHISISAMSFHTDENTDILLIQDATQIDVIDVSFTGPLAEADLSDAGDDIACIRFGSTSALITNQITLDRCTFSGCTYGVRTDQAVQGLTVSNSRFETLYQGALLGAGSLVNGGPNGVRFVHNLFTKVAFEGLVFGNTDPAENTDKCISGYNIFLDVGNNFNGLGNPVASVLVFNGDRNVSIGDMFERDTNDNNIFSRIDLNAKKVFAIDDGERVKFGTYNREAGQQESVTTTGGTPVEMFTISTDIATAFSLKYRFTESAGGAIRFGTLTVVSQDSDDSVGSLVYTDDYSENSETGLVLSAEQTGSTTVSIKYTATTNGTFNYSFDHLG